MKLKAGSWYFIADVFFEKVNETNKKPLRPISKEYKAQQSFACGPITALPAKSVSKPLFLPLLTVFPC